MDHTPPPRIPDLATLPPVLTRREACDVMRCSERHLDRLVARGRIKYLPGLGRKAPRILLSDVERVLLGDLAA